MSIILKKFIKFPKPCVAIHPCLGMWWRVGPRNTPFALWLWRGGCRDLLEIT